ncbi:hypothetical protein [Oxynema aestuarii]|uniref:Uncharacterized protein n=1 Tax=Oxynema aestuarii AP17 TaxID=2064643 RepID=A0A6H1TS42_9CYAN|nr:hypothetical protein [Oxynema aestuarii]QIZ69361.1 hypothetical protein HCG48_01155 [Oxynema aestuarii AP17]
MKLIKVTVLNLPKIKLAIFIALGIICFFSTVQSLNASDFSKEQLWARFDRMDNDFRGGDGFSKVTNEYGSLAWGQSYLFEAYLDMYEATQDTKYLDKFVTQADRVIANTDKNRNIQDYRGRSVVGWGATKYSPSNIRVVHLVHTGMITYPLVNFAKIVNNDLSLNQFQDKANAYVRVANEALSVFDENWTFNQNTEVGYYQFAAREQPVAIHFSEKAKSTLIPAPFNQQLAVGRTAILLCHIQSNMNPFCKKANALGKHFLNRVRQDSNGFYVWDYWYGEALDISQISKKREDVSHGGIDVDFAILAHRHSMVFNSEDINSFSKTYRKISQNGKFAGLVDGTKEARSLTFIPLWMEMSPYDCKPWQDFKDLLGEDRLPEKGYGVMLGIAKLAKYYDVCINQL